MFKLAIGFTVSLEQELKKTSGIYWLPGICGLVTFKKLVDLSICSEASHETIFVPSSPFQDDWKQNGVKYCLGSYGGGKNPIIGWVE